MAYTTFARPKIISAVCIAGFIGIVFSMPSVFSPETRRMGDFYPALFGLLISLRFIAYVGLWHMKRWGVELYLTVFTAGLIQSILLDDISYVGGGLSVGAATIMIMSYKKMDRNL